MSKQFLCTECRSIFEQVIYYTLFDGLILRYFILLQQIVIIINKRIKGIIFIIMNNLK